MVIGDGLCLELKHNLCHLGDMLCVDGDDYAMLGFKCNGLGASRTAGSDTVVKQAPVLEPGMYSILWINCHF